MKTANINKNTMFVSLIALIASSILLFTSCSDEFAGVINDENKPSQGSPNAVGETPITTPDNPQEPVTTPDNPQGPVTPVDNPAKKTGWSLLTDIGIKRNNASATIINDEMYVFGGEENTSVKGDFFSVDLGTGVLTSLDTPFVAIKTNASSSLVPASVVPVSKNIKLTDAVMAAVQDMIFVYGGLDEAGSVNSSLLYFGYTLTGSKKEWVVIGESDTNGTYPKTGRFAHSVFVADDFENKESTLYFMGGYASQGGPALTDVYSLTIDRDASPFDPSHKPDWAKKAVVPSGAGQFRTVYDYSGDQTKARLISFGNSDYVYDIKSDEYSSMVSIDRLAERTLFGSAQIGNDVYVFGGKLSSGGETVNELWKYNTITSTWKKVSSGPDSRSGSVLLLYRGMLIVYGGYSDTDNRYFSDIWKYNPDEDDLNQ